MPMKKDTEDDLDVYLNRSKFVSRYYYDSAAGCGACCALAGACRTLRKTWTGLGLAGLSALSCAGLLLLAAKSPKPGTPLHDVTAGALCGVSLLGAVLALLALLSPRCNLGRHRRVHSWIPRLSPWFRHILDAPSLRIIPAKNINRNHLYAETVDRFSNVEILVCQELNYYMGITQGEREV